MSTEQENEKEDGKKCLEVTILNGRGLTRADVSGSRLVQFKTKNFRSDPFIELSIKHSSCPKRMTKVINSELNPVWNENFKFFFNEKDDPMKAVLYGKVWDHDKISHDDPSKNFFFSNPVQVGVFKVPVSFLPKDKKIDVSLKLRNKHTLLFRKEKGVINMEITAKGFGVEKEDDSREKNEDLKMLLVNLHSVSFYSVSEVVNPFCEFKVLFQGKLKGSFAKSASIKGLKGKKPGEKYIWNKEEGKNKVLINVQKECPFDVVEVCVYHESMIKKPLLGKCYVPLTLLPFEKPSRRQLFIYNEKGKGQKKGEVPKKPTGILDVTFRAIGFGKKDFY